MKTLTYLLLPGLTVMVSHGFSSPGLLRSPVASSLSSSRFIASPPRSSSTTRLSVSYEDLQERLPSQKVVDVISRSSSSKVVAADVAASAGISLSQARQDLQALAAVSQGDIAVSNDGELIYSFPRDLNGVLAQNSRKFKLFSLARKVWPAVFWGLRVSFGVLLLVSLAAIFSTILFIQTSGSSDERRDDRRGGGGGFGGGFGMGFWGPSPFDFFYYRPYGYYGYYGRDNYKDPEEMGLLESIFSYIFGDGNPNADLDERRTKLAANVIRENGGAVTAEQLAPFCQDAPSPSDMSKTYVDEGFVLPLVTSLNGEAKVTDDGTIVYTFPELQVSAKNKGILTSPSNSATEATILRRAGLGTRASSSEILQLLRYNRITTRGSLERSDLIRTLEKVLPEATAEEEEVAVQQKDVLQEREWKFSLAPEFNRYLAGGLGAVNLGGALYLGNLLGQYAIYGVRLPSYMGLVQAGYPLLLAYAVLFNVIPVARKFWIGQQNIEIQKRNTIRRQWRTALEASLGSGEIGRKIRAAQKMKTKMKRLGADSKEILFDTSKSTVENQQKKEQTDLDDFDRKLRESQDGGAFE